MKLTYRGEYALLALLHLARESGRIVPIEVIASTQKIPRKYLEQILLILKRGGYVKSTRGKAGGYTLALSPGKISVAEIVRLFEGPIAPTTSVSRYFYSESPIEVERSLVKLFKEVRDLVSTKLEKTKLKDLL